jgi:hypothetical protein
LPPVTGRRRGFRWRGLAIFVVVVLVLLVGLDRIALVVAERQIAAKIQSKQDLPTRPSVSIKGFPFVTQVIGRHFNAAELHANHLVVGDAQQMVDIGTLDARVGGIDTNHSFSSATARSVAGTATISYSELTKLLGVPLSYAGAGRLTATESVTVLGQKINGSVTAAVGITGATMLTFSDVTVAVSDAGVTLPQAVTDQLGSVFKNQLSLAGLPFGLAVQSVTAGASGVSISATAQNVALN